MIQAFLALIVNIDRSADGSVRTGQQPLIDLQQQIGPSSP